MRRPWWSESFGRRIFSRRLARSAVTFPLTNVRAQDADAPDAGAELKQVAPEREPSLCAQMDLEALTYYTFIFLACHLRLLLCS